MYNNSIVGGGGIATGGATLAATGFNILWAVLATFAFLAVGAAIMRVIPKRNN